MSGINVAWSSAKAWLKANRRYAHYVLFNSLMAWESGNRPEGVGYISNGVDREAFPLKVPIEKRLPTVLSIGSPTMRSQIQHHAGVHGHRRRPRSINIGPAGSRCATRSSVPRRNGFLSGTLRPTWEYLEGIDPTP